MSFDPTDRNLARALRPPSQAPWVLMFLTLGAAGAGGAWLWGETGKAKATAAAAEVRISAVEAKRAALAPQAEKATKLEAENADLKVAKETLEHDKEALAHDVEAKTGELAALKGTADKLQAQMKEEIARGDVRLTESGGKVRVGLVGQDLFQPGGGARAGGRRGRLRRG